MLMVAYGTFLLPQDYLVLMPCCIPVLVAIVHPLKYPRCMHRHQYSLVPATNSYMVFSVLLISSYISPPGRPHLSTGQTEISYHMLQRQPALCI